MNWLVESSTMILLSVALVSFFESLALLGLVVPGAVLLFSLAAIANSANIHPFQLMVFGASGALAGDILSFIIGRNLKNNIAEWPFLKRHKSWIEQGQWFMERWGWLSVIIGRFLGPLRPVIPFTAGSLGMLQKIFIPLSTLTVCMWAPLYLLPGYYTGELAELWDLQPLSTRSLVVYALTAAAIVSSTIILYHHTHPEQLHIRGWLTRHQADRWPIPSLAVVFISIIAFTLLVTFPPEDQDSLFHAWANDWKSLPISSFWHAANYLTSVQLIRLEVLLIALWLIISNRITLAFLLTISFESLWFFGQHALTWGFANIDTAIAAQLSAFIFVIGFLANIINSRFHGLNRWPIYLLASLVILTEVIAVLWEGGLTISQVGGAIAITLFFNGLLRAAWQGFHLPLSTAHNSGLISLIVITNLAYFLIVTNS